MAKHKATQQDDKIRISTPVYQKHQMELKSRNNKKDINLLICHEAWQVFSRSIWDGAGQSRFCRCLVAERGRMGDGSVPQANIHARTLDAGHPPSPRLPKTSGWARPSLKLSFSVSRASCVASGHRSARELRRVQVTEQGGEKQRW